MMSASQLVWYIALPFLTLAQGNVEFEKTLSKALHVASSEKRQLMLYFTATNCGDCKQIDEFFVREDIQRAMEARYVAAKVDIKSFDGNACGQIYGIEEVPALVVVQPDGELTLKKQKGLTVKDVESIVIHGYIPDMDTPVEQQQQVPARSSIGANTTRQAEPATDDGNYALQVGFFSSKTNADNLSREIQEQGYQNTWIDEEERNDKTFYRVLVGSYVSSDYAASDLRSLENSGFAVKVHKYRP